MRAAILLSKIRGRSILATICGAWKLQVFTRRRKLRATPAHSRGMPPIEPVVDQVKAPPPGSEDTELEFDGMGIQSWNDQSLRAA
jgi:hypothetical protein